MAEQIKALRKKGTDRVFPYAEQLATRADMEVVHIDKPQHGTKPDFKASPEGEKDDPAIDSMTKDELAEYAKKHHDTDLDKRQSVDTLREQVRALEDQGGS
ncbi:hypothetical protein [Halorhodospira halophila]|uniref:hypothetical protein n=1 Tax=Halorhodospira halophila TaxID=1053 RepID=UPI00191142BA|nr:hypothetical protein [Halorhodospira halophila]MBK5942715.1 hypothetical protein [Halorhodospira halophila]